MSMTSRTSFGKNEWYRACWQRLYAQARMRGCDAHSAEDAVQEVFATLARLGRLEAMEVQPVESQQGLLSRCLTNRMARDYRDLRRIKRGGRVSFVSLDDPQGDALDIADERSGVPGVGEDGATVERALEMLRGELKPETWRLLSCVLIDGERPVSYNGAQRVALHRARVRLRQLVGRVREGL